MSGAGAAGIIGCAAVVGPGAAGRCWADTRSEDASIGNIAAPIAPVIPINVRRDSSAMFKDPTRQV
jgi:hypothetical protein